MYPYYTEKKSIAEKKPMLSDPTQQKTKLADAATAANTLLATLTGEDRDFLEAAQWQCNMPHLAFHLHKLYPEKAFSDIVGSVNKACNGKQEFSLQDVLDSLDASQWPKASAQISPPSNTSSAYPYNY